MKKIFILMYLIFLSLDTHAFIVESSWSSKFKKVLRVKCSGEKECKIFCSKEDSCSTIETYCRSCIGNDPYVTSVFSGMGQLFRNDGTKVSDRVLFNLLSSHRFTSITSKSIYNNIDRFNSLRLRQRFSSLCPIKTKEPIVIFKLDIVNHSLGKAKYVICNNGKGGMVGYNMTNDADVDLYKSRKRLKRIVAKNSVKCMETVNGFHNMSSEGRFNKKFLVRSEEVLSDEEVKINLLNDAYKRARVLKQKFITLSVYKTFSREKLKDTLFTLPAELQSKAMVVVETDAEGRTSFHLFIGSFGSELLATDFLSNDLQYQTDFTPTFYRN